MHSKCDNIKIIINDEADEVIKLYKFLIQLKIDIKIIGISER